MGGDLVTPSTAVGQPLPHLSSCIYLDYNATTPIFPEVAEAMAPYLVTFGNPSSGHVYGRQSRAAVDLARSQVAALVNADLDEIFFVSCGTEADNWAIWGAVAAARQAAPPGAPPPHVVSSVVEHPAVLEFLKALKQQGLLDYTLVPVDGEGVVSPADVAAALTPATALVSLMHSNNETGGLQPVADVAAEARRRGALVHSDAAQSLGKVEVDVRALGVDLLTIVGHKFGAPKGVAALYIRRGVNIANLLSGGSQEGGNRAGTESVLLIAGLGKAAELARLEAEQRCRHQGEMQERLRRGLEDLFPPEAVRINGPSDPGMRLPNTLSISIRGLAAASLLKQLGDRLAASAGAACHSSEGPAVSGVLAAMRVEPTFAVGTLRLSTGRHTTAEEVDRAVALIGEAAALQGVPLRRGGRAAAGGAAATLG